ATRRPNGFGVVNARGRSTLRFNGSRCASCVRLGLRSLSRTSASLLGTGSRRSRVIAPDSIASGSTTSGACASCGPTLDRRRWRHPGEVLMEDFIEGFGITQNKLAVSFGVPLRRINEIVHGKRGVTADTALRLAKYFGTSAEFWINLQSHYELDRAEELAGDQIAAIRPLLSA